MNNFYSFQWAQKRGAVLVEPLEEYNDKSTMLGDDFIKEPFMLKISEGKKLYDIIHFQDPFNFVISERLYLLMKNACFTGWRGFEVRIEGISEKYYGFQVLGRCGELTKHQTSGFVTGYEFDEKSWDGTDFFCPQGTLLIFCTERVSELWKTNHVTNFELRDIRTVEWYNFKH